MSNSNSLLSLEFELAHYSQGEATTGYNTRLLATSTQLESAELDVHSSTPHRLHGPTAF